MYISMWSRRQAEVGRGDCDCDCDCDCDAMVCCVSRISSGVSHASDEKGTRERHQMKRPDPPGSSTSATLVPVFDLS